MTAPVPVTGKTPIYELEYLLEGEPAFHYRAKMERNSLKLEALLQARALAPPAAVDLAAVAGRVTALEAGAWTTLPLTGGTTLAHDTPNPNCQYRQEGRRVWVRGWGKSTGGVVAGAVLWGPLPPAFRPPADFTIWPIKSATLTAVRVDVLTDGSGKLMSGSLTANEFINLNACTWALP